MKLRLQSWSVFIGVPLVAATLWVYLPVRQHGFVAFDDPEYIADNPMVQAGLTWAGVKWAFTTGYFSYWHPLTWLSHLLDVTLFGPGPAGAHAVNVCFHLANTLLVFVVLHRLTGARWTSALVAAWFALHPLHVESVAWAAERKDVLSAFFFLLTLLAYAHYTRGPFHLIGERGGERWRRWTWYAAALLLFACGLMSKPMVVTLPCVLLLLDGWPLRRLSVGLAFVATSSRDAHDNRDGMAASARPTTKQVLWEKLPFFALTIAASVVTFLVQRQNDAMQSLAGVSLGGRIENAFVAYARYLGKTLWPSDLAFFYPHPGGWPLAGVVAAALLLAGVSVAAWRLRRTVPAAAFGWLLFLGMLVPTIGLVQVGDQSLADRYTYLPLLGVFVALAWGATAAVAHWPRARLAVQVAAALTLVACAARSRDQLRHWRDSESLFRHALAVTEKNYLAHTNLGNVLMAAKRADEAIAHYEHALRLRPDSVHPLNNLATALLRQGRADEAIPRFQRVLALQPDLAEARHALATSLLKVGRTAEALPHLEQLVAATPNTTEIRYDLALALSQAGRTADAIPHLERVLGAEPRNAEVHNNLGWALLQAGRVDDAIARFRAALELQPDAKLVRDNLAAALQRRGQSSSL